MTFTMLSHKIFHRFTRHSTYPVTPPFLPGDNTVIPSFLHGSLRRYLPWLDTEYGYDHPNNRLFPLRGQETYDLRKVTGWEKRPSVTKVKKNRKISTDTFIGKWKLLSVNFVCPSYPLITLINRRKTWRTIQVPRLNTTQWSSLWNN